MSAPRRRSRLVRRLLAVEIVTVLLTVLIAAGVSAVSTRSLVEDDEAARMLGLATALAVSPGVPAAISARDVATLEPAAEAVRRDADASFVTIMTADGTRLTHPDRSLIGQTYQGTFAPAARGETLVETFPGTLGPSVRAIVPVRASPGGPVVGMVAVGLLRVDVFSRVLRELGLLALGAVAAIGLGIVLALGAARRVRRDTLGLEPSEITALHRHHEAVLHAIREGLLVLDADDAIVVVNDEATRLLELSGSAVGKTLEQLGVDPALAARLADPSPVADETVLVGERLLLVNRTRTDDSWVITLRDRTEVEQVMRALDDARSVAGALRFQAHEHANHLQAVSTLIELGAHDDARELAVRWSRDLADLGDDLRDRIADPALAALVLDKATDARDRGVDLRVSGGSASVDGTDDLVTVVGNLLDNALDAVLTTAGRGVVELELADGTDGVDGVDGVTIRVADDGPGLADPEAAFTAGWSTKAGAAGDGAQRSSTRAPGSRGLGLALVARVVERRGGTITTGPGVDGAGTGFAVVLPSGVPEPVPHAAHRDHDPGDAQA
ncbi:sensor histidine kinase [Actinomycetospora sp. OC33-EN08]|uniref:histidine kinase n=1 Tax=Actinomycetospora aurantiaca TaxID=3129233 RepID=A0ABU8MKS4_9PSEU